MIAAQQKLRFWNKPVQPNTAVDEACWRHPIPCRVLRLRGRLGKPACRPGPRTSPVGTAASCAKTLREEIQAPPGEHFARVAAAPADTSSRYASAGARMDLLRATTPTSAKPLHASPLMVKAVVRQYASMVANDSRKATRLRSQRKAADTTLTVRTSPVCTVWAERSRMRSEASLRLCGSTSRDQESNERCIITVLVFRRPVRLSFRAQRGTCCSNHRADKQVPRWRSG